MPVANLQTYRTVAIRVRSTGFAMQGHAMFLEKAVTDRLHMQCGFESVGPPGAAPADVTLDLNITNMNRGGGGIISNPNLVTMDTLLVLTDGQNGEPLGTARIHGKSSGMLMNNAPPENEAIDIVARTVADILTKSGCTGPRLARAEPPPAPPGPPDPAGPGSGTPPAGDEAHRAEADALNKQGKEKLQSADLPGALAAFQQANALLPDARYEFNVCLTFEAQEKWKSAMDACKQARAMNPKPELQSKIDHRLDLLAHRQ